MLGNSYIDIIIKKLRIEKNVKMLKYPDIALDYNIVIDAIMHKQYDVAVNTLERMDKTSTVKKCLYILSKLN